MSFVIDIKTRVFDADDRAYRLFPGQGYRFFQAMKEHSIVFLDNPGIPLPGATGYKRTDDMLQHIARAEEKQPFVNANGDNPRVELNALDAALPPENWTA